MKRSGPPRSLPPGRGSRPAVERDSGSRPRRPGGEPPWLASIREALAQRVTLFDENGCTEAAATCRRDLAIVEAESRRWWLEELSLTAAAAELGCSTDTIGRRLKNGALPNVASSGRPRVPRAALWAHAARQDARSGVVDAYLAARTAPTRPRHILLAGPKLAT